MPMELNHLREGALGLLRATHRLVGTASVYRRNDADQPDSFRQLTFRAILRKQFESLTAIVELSAEGRGNVAIALLRPMCEEIIWCDYLVSLPPEDASLLLRCMAQLGIHDTFVAQKSYSEAVQMGDLGFSEESEQRLAASARSAARDLKMLSRKLGWPERKLVMPTTKYLAKVTNRLEMYNFLYHATSRVVHFSVTELMRLVWGKPGEVRVASNFFDRYWGDFSLYWGGWIYAQTFVAISPVLTDMSTDLRQEELATFEAAVKTLVSGGGVPILTQAEVMRAFQS
ncbi:MAG: DUF5677 domain-containing protein [Acidobacteriia bacterium]|nr:DUF5677 domain-containing protein [Terriglobia bacterium]